MVLEQPNQDQGAGSEEGKLAYAGGDFVYRPGSETDPEKILASAKQAVETQGGFDSLRGNLIVSIPGMGEFPFDEDSTIEGLLSANARQEKLESMTRGLTPVEADQVIDFIKKLKENRE